MKDADDPLGERAMNEIWHGAVREERCFKVLARLPATITNSFRP
jgi:hypothetical protein